MTDPPRPTVDEPSPMDLAWEKLAEELTPTKSLANISTVTARVLTNITLIGTILTGLGLIATGLLITSTLAQRLVVAAIITAVLAVGCALTAQVLTIRPQLNVANLVEVKAWYRQQLRARAYPTRAATLLLLTAVVFAGAATSTILLENLSYQPTVAVSQTQTTSGNDGEGNTAGSSDLHATSITLSVEVIFPGVAATDTVTLTVTASPPIPATTLARAVFTPNIDGTATRTITISNIPRQSTINITANSRRHQCDVRLDLSTNDAPSLSCRKSPAG